MPLTNRWEEQNPLIRRVQQHGALTTLFRSVAPQARQGRISPLRLGQAMPAVMPTLAEPTQPDTWEQEEPRTANAWFNAPTEQQPTNPVEAASPQSPPGRIAATVPPTVQPRLNETSQSPVLVTSSAEPTVVAPTPAAAAPLAPPIPVQRQFVAPSEAPSGLPVIAPLSQQALAAPMQQTAPAAVTAAAPLGVAPAPVAASFVPPASTSAASRLAEQHQAAAPTSLPPTSLQRARLADQRPTPTAAAPTPLLSQAPASSPAEQTTTAFTSVQPQREPTDRATAPVAVPAAPNESPEDRRWTMLQAALRKARGQETEGSVAPPVQRSAQPAIQHQPVETSVAPAKPAGVDAPRRAFIQELPTQPSVDPVALPVPQVERGNPPPAAPVIHQSISRSRMPLADEPAELPRAIVSNAPATMPALPQAVGPTQINIAQPAAATAPTTQPISTAPSDQPLREPQARQITTALAAQTVAPQTEANTASSSGAVQRVTTERVAPFAPLQPEAAASIPVVEHDAAQPIAAASETRKGAAEQTAAEAEETAWLPASQEEQAVPLDAVWPVQRLVAPSEEVVAAAFSPRNKPTEDALVATTPPLLTERVRQRLEAPTTARPTDSKIDIIAPRRPRPANYPPVQPKPEGIAPAATAVQRTENETQPAAPKPSLSAPPALIPTEIGPLPADLWQLIGETPPQTTVQQPSTSRAPASTVASGSPVHLAPAQSVVQTAQVDPTRLALATPPMPLNQAKEAQNGVALANVAPSVGTVASTAQVDHVAASEGTVAPDEQVDEVRLPVPSTAEAPRALDVVPDTMIMRTPEADPPSFIHQAQEATVRQTPTIARLDKAMPQQVATPRPVQSDVEGDAVRKPPTVKRQQPAALVQRQTDVAPPTSPSPSQAQATAAAPSKKKRRKRPTSTN